MRHASRPNCRPSTSWCPAPRRQAMAALPDPGTQPPMRTGQRLWWSGIEPGAGAVAATVMTMVLAGYLFLAIVPLAGGAVYDSFSEYLDAARTGHHSLRLTLLHALVPLVLL